jgi:hypothetical protein
MITVQAFVMFELATASGKNKIRTARQARTKCAVSAQLRFDVTWPERLCSFFRLLDSSLLSVLLLYDVIAG